MKTKNLIIDQGDILLRRVSKLPAGFRKKREGGVLREGEVTGHAHKVENATVWDVLNQGIFVEVDNKGRLVHEEHGTFENIPVGIYQLDDQREYTAGDVRRVLD